MVEASIVTTEDLGAVLGFKQWNTLGRIPMGSQGPAGILGLCLRDFMTLKISCHHSEAIPVSSLLRGSEKDC